MRLPTPDKVPATPEEVLDLMWVHRGYVSECLTEPQVGWTPTLQVLCRGPGGPDTDGVRLYTLNVPFNEDDEKRGAMERIGQSLYREKALPAAAVLSSEVWRAPDRKDGPEPRHHPDRREAICIFGCDMTGRHAAMCHAEITRDLDGRMVLGAFSPVLTTGIRPVLLHYFWRGFFADIVAKYGIPRRR